jgi:hypothetical protein
VAPCAAVGAELLLAGGAGADRLKRLGIEDCPNVTELTLAKLLVCASFACKEPLATSISPFATPCAISIRLREG